MHHLWKGGIWCFLSLLLVSKTLEEGTTKIMDLFLGDGPEHVDAWETALCNGIAFVRVAPSGFVRLAFGQLGLGGLVGEIELTREVGSGFRGKDQGDGWFLGLDGFLIFLVGFVAVSFVGVSGGVGGAGDSASDASGGWLGRGLGSLGGGENGLHGRCQKERGWEMCPGGGGLKGSWGNTLHIVSR
jgi:hypothetical protein